MLRRALLTTVSTLPLLVVTPMAFAADVVRPPIVVAPGPLPAVSAFNAKLGAFGGSVDDHSGWGVFGSFSLPLQTRWGLQVDSLAGSAGGAAFWGVGGHLFWRDPTRALFGLYASWVDWTPFGAQVSKLGAEVALYRGPFSFEGVLAAQGGSFQGVAGHATAAWYLGENFRIDASYRHLEGIGGIGGAGAELQFGTSGFSLFANGNWGDDYQTVVGGLKYYIGPQKSLIRRHREDDPDSLLPYDLHELPPANVPCRADACVPLQPEPS
jgi:hypothetical protein